MPVLEGLWGQDLRMRDSGLGVEVGVCADETPRSPVWGPLRMPPVTCGGGLSLALELPALIRQLRAAWRARRGGPVGPERSEASTWEEAEKEAAEEMMLEREDGSARLKGNMFIMNGRTILTDSQTNYGCAPPSLSSVPARQVISDKRPSRPCGFGRAAC